MQHDENTVFRNTLRVESCERMMSALWSPCRTETRQIPSSAVVCYVDDSPKADMATDATFTWVRETGGAITHFAVRDATNLNANGTVLWKSDKPQTIAKER